VSWRDGLAEADPDFLELADGFAEHPWRHGVLEPKVKAFVLLAVDAAATHRNAAGVREDIELALRHGATPPEIAEVLELTSTLGIHACNCGVPILLDELEAAGQGVDLDAPLTPRQEQIKALFTEKRGYWNDFWNGLLHLDPEFFAAYTAFSANAWETGTLEPKVRELVYTAFDASATHMFEPGLRQHIRNAIAYGATKEEIMEVFQLASGAGLGAFALGAPALREALAERQPG
jgi:alkylhydroperoxidase/carboxymuconolactone decarboxylase family protein YurZ